MPDGSVIIDTKLDDKKLSGQLSKLKSNIGGMLKGVAQVGATALGGITTAAVGVAKESLEAFATFDKGMNEVFTLLPGISADAMDGMKTQVKDFAKKFGVLPEQTIPALYQALSAGIPQKNVFTFMESANALAKGGVASLEDSVGVLGTIVNNYAKQGIDAARASDYLVTAVKDGVTTIPELATALGDVVPSAASMNVKFDEVSASMATLTATLGKGSTGKATTQLRAMFDELGKTGTNVDKIFRKVSGKSFPDFIKSGGDMQGALKLLNDYSKKNNLSIKELFGSTEAGSAALILGSQSVDKFSATLKDMKGSTGAAQTAFETMNKGIIPALDRMKATVQTTLIDVGNNLAGGAENVINGLTGLLTGDPAAAETLSKGLTEILTKALDMITTALPQVGKVAVSVIQALVDGLTKNIDSIATAAVDIILSLVDLIIKNLPAVLKMGIVILMALVNGLLGALPALITAGIDMILSLIDGILNALPQLLDAIITAIPLIIQAIATNLPRLIEGGIKLVLGLVMGIINAIPQLIQAIVDSIPMIITALVESLPLLINGGVQLVLGLIQGIISCLPQLITAVVNMIPQVVSALIGLIPTIIDAGAQLLGGLITGILTVVPQLLKAGGDIAVSFLDGLWKGIQDNAGKFLDSIKNFFKNMVDGVLNVLGIHSPSKVARDKIMGNFFKGAMQGVKKLGPELQTEMMASFEVTPAMTKTINHNVSGAIQMQGVNERGQLIDSVDIAYNQVLSRLVVDARN